MASVHHCHACGCSRAVPPRLLMCGRHWRMVPREIQAQVWRTYRPGQEIDKNPSEAYLLVQRAAVWAVFVAEGGCKWPDVPEVGSRAYTLGPRIYARESPPLFDGNASREAASAADSLNSPSEPAVP